MKYLFSLVIIGLLASPFAFAQDEYATTSRMKLEPAMAPFYHGVASGDPLKDAVIIWTRVTTQDTAAIVVDWKVATDMQFNNVVATGTANTDASMDYTVKVDVTGLSPATYYYYQFEHAGLKSLIGRTKTAPSGDNDHVRFAVVSCSRYTSGYFNAYQHITFRNDIDAVIHLGDYIYENGGSASFDTSRAHVPNGEIILLEDYRARYSQYRLDEDLRRLHQQYPMITTWDDHETTNNSWRDGADNHNPGEGNWEDRKSFANMAYFEWLPIRETGANAGEQSLYRKINYGDLVDVMVLDTRIEGRDEQNGTGAAVQNDTARSILGKTQFNWLTDNLKSSNSQWKVLAQQVMVAPLLAFGVAVNEDQWDGYPVERKNLFDTILSNNIEDVVVITGDIHTAWANDLPHPDQTYNPSTGAGSVGVEFVVSSVTTENAGALGALGEGIVLGANPHIKFVDLSERGYLILDLTKTKTQSDWYFVSTIEDTIFTASYAEGWYTNDGERFIRKASAEAPGLTGQAPLAPLTFDNTVGVNDIVDEIVIVGTYPNPFQDELIVQYYVDRPGAVQLQMIDLAGKVVMQKQMTQHPQGVNYLQLNTAGLASGAYLVSMRTEGQVFRTKVIKGK